MPKSKKKNNNCKLERTEQKSHRHKAPATIKIRSHEATARTKVARVSSETPSLRIAD